MDRPGSNCSTYGWRESRLALRLEMRASETKAHDGLTCLPSPTMRTCLPRSSAGSAVVSDCEASSRMTRSNAPTSAGSDCEMRHVGMIQHGIDVAHSVSAAARSPR